MNRLYSISYSENAEKTQEFLEKIIFFLRYYTGEEEKLVRLDEELSYVKLFIDTLSVTTGKGLEFIIQADMSVIRDIYVPARVFLSLAKEFLINDGIKSGRITFSTFEDKKGISLVLLTELGDAVTPEDSGIKEVQYIFHKVCGFNIKTSVAQKDKGVWEIVFLLPGDETDKG